MSGVKGPMKTNGKPTRKSFGTQKMERLTMRKQGLYANIHAKRKRISSGSGETMRKARAKGATTAANFKRAAKTAKKK